jgi:hypothetical protein
MLIYVVSALLHAVQAAHIQNVVRLPQYFMTVAPTKAEKTDVVTSTSENSVVVSGSEQYDLSHVLPATSIMFNMSNLSK